MPAPIKSETTQIKPKIGRSRKGCLTCRSDRKRCDEVHPNCGRCVKLNYECVWPAPILRPFVPKVRNRARSESASTARSWGESSDASSSLAPVVHSLPTPCSPIPPYGGPWDLFSGTQSSPQFGAGQGYISTSHEVLTPSTSLESIPFSAGGTGASISAQGSTGPGHLLPAHEINTWPSHHQGSVPSGGASTVNHPHPLAPTRGVSLHGDDTFFTPLSAISPHSTSPSESSYHPFSPVSAPSPSTSPFESRVPLIRPQPLFPPVCPAAESSCPYPLGSINLPYALGLGPSSDYRSCEVARTLNDLLSVPTSALQRTDISTLTTNLRKSAGEAVDRALEDWDSPSNPKLGGVMTLAHWEHAQNGSRNFVEYLGTYASHFTNGLQTAGTLNLAAVDPENHSALLAWSWSDVLSSIYLRRPSTIPFSAVVSPTDNQPKGLLGLMGVPDQLVVSLADISNLSLAMPGEEWSSPQFQQQASTILSSLTSFTPSFISSGLNSVVPVARIAFQEIWRQTGLLYFHQRIGRLAPGHAAIASAMRQILQLAETLERSMSDYHSLVQLGLPFFLAATVAVAPEERAACRARMTGLGQQQGLRDNVQFVERYWWDSTAVGVDWYDYMVQTGSCVSFL